MISDVISELKSENLFLHSGCEPGSHFRFALNVLFLRNKSSKCEPANLFFIPVCSEVPRSPLPSVEKCPDSTFLIFHDTPRHRTVRRLSKRLDFSEK